MRRQYFNWAYLTLASVLTIYGGYMLFYHFNHNNKLNVLSLVFLIIGIVMFLIYRNVKEDPHSGFFKLMDTSIGGG